MTLEAKGGLCAKPLGTVGFMVGALAHLCEGLDMFPSMGWGHENSAGHYIDLISAILGVAFFSVGLLLNLFSKTAN